MIILPKNWGDFQHYKDRAPPWIKLHKGLLDNYEFQRLPIASRALAPMLWLLASEDEKGQIDADPGKLAFRLRMNEAEVIDALKPLIDNNFFSVVQGDSEVLAQPKRGAMPEAEGEREREGDGTQDKPAQTPRKPKPKSQTTEKPDDVAQQVWDDWVALRKAKRTTVSVTAVEGAREEAKKAGVSLDAFLRIWCRRGSQGLEADWLKPGELQQAKQNEFAGAI